MFFRKVLGLTILIPLVLAACDGQPGAANPTPTAEAMVEKTRDAMMGTTPTTEMMVKGTPDAMMSKPTVDTMMPEPTSEMMGTSSPDMMPVGTPAAMVVEPAAWYGASLTNVQDGKAFTIKDFQGKVILVETMAVWCPTCLAQENQLQMALKNIGSQEHLQVVLLDIDPNEDASMLKEYIQTHGFEWTYAVAPKDVARQIGDLYGPQFLNPPSTPMLVIDAKGVAHPLPFGLKDAASLQKILESYLGM